MELPSGRITHTHTKAQLSRPSGFKRSATERGHPFDHVKVILWCVCHFSKCPFTIIISSSSYKSYNNSSSHQKGRLSSMYECGSNNSISISAIPSIGWNDVSWKYHSKLHFYNQPLLLAEGSATFRRSMFAFIKNLIKVN